MKQDWSLPYSDVTQHLDQVGKIYAVYDQYIEQDRLHIERKQHPNLVPLKAIGLGHKSAMVLRCMDQLKPIMSGAIRGYDLTPNGIRAFVELDRPVYSETAEWGHFGRGFTWK